ncbi:protein of unknown function [Pseudomonas mediterranea]
MPDPRQVGCQSPHDTGKSLWRGDLSKRRTAPLGREAALKPDTSVSQTDRLGCCAAQRG